jgi:hypothetical protein
MKCWEPEFWHSKFVEMIKGGSDEELDAASTAFRNAYDEAVLDGPVKKEVQL